MGITLEKESTIIIDEKTYKVKVIRYSNGQRFEKHYDLSNKLIDCFELPENAYNNDYYKRHNLG